MSLSSCCLKRWTHAAQGLTLICFCTVDGLAAYFGHQASEINTMDSPIIAAIIGAVTTIVALVHPFPLLKLKYKTGCSNNKVDIIQRRELY